MPKWTAPTEGTPDCYAGDRVVIIVRERPYAGAKLTDRLVVIEATEDGWHCDDPTYAGYTPSDGILWSMERDVCAIAEVVSPSGGSN